MNSTRLLYWGAQIGGWFLYGALVMLSTYVDNPKNVNNILFYDIFTFVGYAILFSHIMRRLFFRWGWLEMKLPPLLPRIIAASLFCSISIVLATKTTSYLTKMDENEPLSFLKFFNATLSISVLLLFWNALYFTYHFFSKSRKQELNNLTLEASRNEIELKNLRTQLNPHFLFNSLNSIRALIEIEPTKAKNSVTALSNLLRKSLMLGKLNLVSIEEEIEMVSNYLDLEKIRFEERLTIKWDIDESINNFQIPPFSFQMLVENAIKHGISNLIEGGEILVRTEKNKDSIIITVENTGTLKTEVDLGTGIENTRRRLDIQYNGTAKFELFEKENKVISSITFKQ
jgi:two-component system LytT family sensor kinase